MRSRFEYVEWKAKRKVETMVGCTSRIRLSNLHRPLSSRYRLARNDGDVLHSLDT